MATDRDTHSKLVAVIRRLDEALALLDEMDRGDEDGAAYIERAVQRAKRLLRSRFDAYASPLPPKQPSLRRFAGAAGKARRAWPSSK